MRGSPRRSSSAAAGRVTTKSGSPSSPNTRAYSIQNHGLSHRPCTVDCPQFGIRGTLGCDHRPLAALYRRHRPLTTFAWTPWAAFAQESFSATRFTVAADGGLGFNARQVRAAVEGARPAFIPALGTRTARRAARSRASVTPCRHFASASSASSSWTRRSESRSDHQHSSSYCFPGQLLSALDPRRCVMPMLNEKQIDALADKLNEKLNLPLVGEGTEKQMALHHRLSLVGPGGSPAARPGAARAPSSSRSSTARRPRGGRHVEGEGGRAAQQQDQHPRRRRGHRGDTLGPVVDGIVDVTRKNLG